MLTWGRSAAGMLIRDRGRVLLQLRSAYVQYGGTWSIPGGALAHGETTLDAALRELSEESGLEHQHLAVSDRQHVAEPVPGWTYTTHLAKLRGGARELGTPPASAEVTRHEWVLVAEVDDLPLHPGFAASWPEVRAMLDDAPVPRVLFVCIGNICRSPTAELILRDMAARAGVAVEVASRGVGAEDGASMDAGSLDYAARQGLDGTAHRARLFTAEDAERFDVIVALSPAIAQRMRAIAPALGTIREEWVVNPWRSSTWLYRSAYRELERICADVLDGIKKDERSTA
ncbi:NUDIX domain-containing protein [Microbacterium sp.]|uniref:arsenate reductase/protein-tyrosine-phosphatase family protein n=1 Tax=Microbacterium sp. TaxID=51671 RepID=UPI003342D8D6